MSDCCSTIKDLGCTGFCDNIETGETADATGTWKLSLVPGGGYLEATITSGNEIIFSNSLNEDGVTIFEIYKPNGVKFTASGGQDCFQVQIQPGIDLT